MFIILFVITLLLSIIMLPYTAELKDQTKRKKVFEALEYGVLLWTLLLFALTELLSVFHLLTARFITICWCLIAVVMIVLILIKKQQSKESISIIKDAVINSFYEWHKHLWLITFGMVFMLATLAGLGWLAYVTVPYNWDCLAYHLPRIMFWIQNQTVAHFASNDVRQLASSVLAEFVDLHIFLLSGQSDQFINMPQYLSYIMGSAVVLHIAKQLKLRNIWCLTAVILYCATPILYAEAITPQVELVATLWFLIFVDLWIPFIDGRQVLDGSSSCIVRLFMMGLSVGFGYETKPSVCVGQLIFILILGIVCIRKKEKAKNIILAVLIAAIPAIVITLPEISRNLITFGAISSSEVGARQIVGRINPRYLFINFIKNFCFNLPTTLVPESSTKIHNFVVNLAQLLQVDLNDLAIAESGMEYIMADPASFGNDRAISPLQVWSFLIAIIAAFYYVIRKRLNLFDNSKKLFAWGAGISFCIMMVIIRWEPYEVRYETSYLALLCVVIALICDSITRNRPTLEGMLAGVLLFLSTITIWNMFSYHKNFYVENASKKPDGYFVYTAGYQEQLEWMAQIIQERGWTTIGLYPMNSYSEYAIWPVIGYNHTYGYVIYEPDHYANVSMYMYDDPDFHPECVIWIHELPQEGYLDFHGIKYDQYIGKDGYYILYVK